MYQTRKTEKVLSNEMFYPDFGKSEKLFGEKKSQLTEIMENFVRDSKKLISILFKRYIQ
jgi:hypothetical protein